MSTTTKRLWLLLLPFSLLSCGFGDQKSPSEEESLPHVSLIYLIKQIKMGRSTPGKMQENDPISSPWMQASFAFDVPSEWKLIYGKK